MRTRPIVRSQPGRNADRCRFPAGQRAWASEQGFRVDRRSRRAGPRACSPIASPENNSRIWRNPDAPPALARIALKAVVEPRVAQIVWYVDGEPFAVTDPDKPLFWPIKPGAHRFQLRLPAQDEASAEVHVVVE